jgi:hypothetical protein
MNATGFHIPSPEGPGGVVYRGPGYTIVPGGDDIQDGHLWIDDLRRFEEEDPDPESFEGQLSYGYDEDYRATIGMAVEDFPGYETKKIEVRISRYNEAFNPVMRTFVHFTTEYSPAEVLMWGINEIDWMTYEFFDHLPISFMEGYSFPLPDDPPDYWP